MVDRPVELGSPPARALDDQRPLLPRENIGSLDENAQSGREQPRERHDDHPVGRHTRGAGSDDSTLGISGGRNRPPRAASRAEVEGFSAPEPGEISVDRRRGSSDSRRRRSRDVGDRRSSRDFDASRSRVEAPPGLSPGAPADPPAIKPPPVLKPRDAEVWCILVVSTWTMFMEVHVGAGSVGGPFCWRAHGRDWISKRGIL